MGLGGLAYCYGIYPLHFMVFRSMLAAIARRATRPQSGATLHARPVS